MEKKFVVGKYWIFFKGNKIEIFKDDKSIDIINYQDITDISCELAEGGLFKEKKEGKVEISTNTKTLKLDFLKSSNENAQSLVDYYRKTLRSIKGNLLAEFMVINFLGIKNVVKNANVMISVYNDRLEFYPVDNVSKTEVYNYVELIDIEYVEHMQFVRDISIGSTIVFGSYAAAMGVDELVIINMIIMNIKDGDKHHKIVIGQNNTTDYDLKYVYDFIKEQYNK